MIEFESLNIAVQFFHDTVHKQQKWKITRLLLDCS